MMHTRLGTPVAPKGSCEHHKSINLCAPGKHVPDTFSTILVYQDMREFLCHIQWLLLFEEVHVKHEDVAFYLGPINYPYFTRPHFRLSNLH